MSLDLAAFHAYAQGDLAVYPGDWFGDAALVAEEVGRLREALQAAEDRLVAIYDIAGDNSARAALAQNTVEGIRAQAKPSLEEES